MVPGCLYFIIFRFVPMWYLQMAMRDFQPLLAASKNMSLIQASPWVGFENFIILFKSPYFLRALRNTLILSGYNILFGFPIPIFLALLMNEIRRPLFKRLVQSTLYLPHFLSWVIVYGIFSALLSKYGIVNLLLFGRESVMDGEGILFFASQEYFRGVLVISNLWKTVGWGTIVYLAAISGVDESLYEAALIDGANRWQQTFHITLPTILPTIIVVFLLSIGDILNIFAQVLVMYNAAVYEVSDVIGTLVYRQGIVKGDFSYATAAGLFQSFVGMVLAVSMNVIAKKTQQISLY
jgi:putative aldouronate transport system permease protein